MLFSIKTSFSCLIQELYFHNVSTKINSNEPNETYVSEALEYLKTAADSLGDEASSPLSVRRLESIAKARFGLTITADCLYAQSQSEKKVVGPDKV